MTNPDRFIQGLFALIGSLVFIPMSHDVLARDIHYGGVKTPGILTCDRNYWSGQRKEAIVCYQKILSDSSSNFERAEASWVLKDLQRANDYYRRAVEEEPDNLSIKVRWGDLYAATHQGAEAMAIYQEVLSVDAKNSFALIGAATVLATGFESAAGGFLDALDRSTAEPGAIAKAELLRATIALENGNLEQADANLDVAQEQASRDDWPLLDVFALRAAADLLRGVNGDWTQRALKINPRFGKIYSVPAHFYVITRRYREAIELYEKAVQIDPELSKAHRELGINLLRDNRVDRARRHLEFAYTQDPFSPVSVNTLRLLDSLKNFDTLSHSRPDFVDINFRLHRDESKVLGPYAAELTWDALKVFQDRYGFVLQEPIMVEIYPDHEDFAVRTAGMPGIGILGAAFGYLVAMDSPSARPVDEFQWGTTLWHELAHIYTLEATNHLVPRWFSEGASVFEEWQSGPNPGVRISMGVLQAIKDDRMLSVANLDEGFIRPTYEQQVIVSYMQAGLICDFIYRKDPSGLKKMLRAFANGSNTEDAITAVFKQSAKEFDQAFENYVEQTLGGILSKLEVWHEKKDAVRRALGEEAWSDAIELSQDLIELTPNYVEPDSPYLSLVAAHDGSGNEEEALLALEAYWSKGGYFPSALTDLAQRLEQVNQLQRATKVLETLQWVDPFDDKSHNRLGELYLQTGRPQQALREFNVLMALVPHDKATVHYQLARAYVDLNDFGAAKKELLLALEIAPNYRPAQKLLLRVVAGSDS